MLSHKAVLRAAQRVTAPSPNNGACAKRVSFKQRGGAAMKAVLLAVQCVRLPSRAISRRLSSALKRCNDVGGRLLDAGELF
jgi:hypothetical protein